jgi:hypothetical protein
MEIKNIKKGINCQGDDETKKRGDQKSKVKMNFKCLIENKKRINKIRY